MYLWSMAGSSREISSEYEHLHLTQQSILIVMPFFMNINIAVINIYQYKLYFILLYVVIHYDSYKLQVSGGNSVLGNK